MLAAALPLAAALGIDPARIDCDADNVASRRVIEAERRRPRRGARRQLSSSGCRRRERRRGPRRGRTRRPASPFEGPCGTSTCTSPSAGRGATTATSPRCPSRVGAGRAGAEAARRLDAYVDGSPPSGSGSGRRTTCAACTRSTSAAVPRACWGRSGSSELLELFRPHLTPHAEVTVETNPEDVDDEYAAWAASARLGAGGARGAVRPRRARLARRAELLAGAARRARPHRAGRPGRRPSAVSARAGVANAGLDLIHGIPGQTPELLGADIAAVLELRPDHVSWYELDVVEGTALAARLARPSRRRGRLAGAARSIPAPCRPTPWMTCARRATGASCASSPAPATTGTRSATSRWPGRRARHNVAYWRARPYLGLGPGAVSTVGARRWTNAADPDAWAAALAAGEPAARASRTLDAGHARPRAPAAGGPLRRARPARRGGRRRRPGASPPSSPGWIGFPAQWYNPRDAKGEARGRRGVRAPVSRSHLRG